MSFFNRRFFTPTSGKAAVSCAHTGAAEPYPQGIIDLHCSHTSAGGVDMDFAYDKQVGQRHIYLQELRCLRSALDATYDVLLQ